MIGPGEALRRHLGKSIRFQGSVLHRDVGLTVSVGFSATRQARCQQLGTSSSLQPKTQLCGQNRQYGRILASTMSVKRLSRLRRLGEAFTASYWAPVVKVLSI